MDDSATEDDGFEEGSRHEEESEEGHDDVLEVETWISCQCQTHFVFAREEQQDPLGHTLMEAGLTLSRTN